MGKHWSTQLLLTRYVNERLLYRLSVSPHAPRFVLKGAALFTIWTGAPHRATRDIDLLGFGESSEVHLREVFLSVLGADSIADGVAFDVEGLTVPCSPSSRSDHDGYQREHVSATAAAQTISLRASRADRLSTQRW